jgi:hypothetical protein
MRRATTCTLALALACGCGGSGTGGGDLGTGGDAGAVDAASYDLTGPPFPTGANVADVIVDNGPAGNSEVDVPFVKVTICIPGTTTCEIIDHVSVDSGSSGLRILVSALATSIALPQKNATTGNPLAECLQFADGFTWGSVRFADVKIAGEVAPNIPIQLVGDPAFPAVPTDCSSSGPSENTVATFGAKGLIGISYAISDCGTSCAGMPAATGAYYSCAGATCTPIAVPVAEQVSNPIHFFSVDNNGAILQFPPVDPGVGARTLPGTLTFGIGTQPNNGLGGATVLTIDSFGNFTTVYNGQTFATSFLDSGSNSLSFDDASIPRCSGTAGGFYCPTSTLSLTAQNTGQNNATTMVSFGVASADQLFSDATATAFNDLAGPGLDAMTFDWGFPFYIGRIVFVAFEGAPTPGGNGPYVAY